MRPAVKKRMMFVAAASAVAIGSLGYPALKSVYPIRNKTTVVDDYLDLPTATADLTKDIIFPEGIGAGTEVPISVPHRLLLSKLKSKSPVRRQRALDELARQRRWNDAECLEIAQALDRSNIVKLARTFDADLRLFLPPPSMEFIEKTLSSSKVEKLVKSILKNVSEKSDSCSSCTNFYTNLSIRMRPDSDILALSELDQVDKTLRLKSRKRKKSAYNEDIIKLKAVLNNVICGEEQALSMVKSGLLLALIYFRHKYKNDVQINALLSQILADLATMQSTRDHIFIDGWIQTLTLYTRSEHLEISLPAIKALVNLDEEAARIHGIYGNHIYLLSPQYHDQSEPKFDVVFVHGLVGTVFKSWRQGSITLDSLGDSVDKTPTTELLPVEAYSDEQGSTLEDNCLPPEVQTKCWPKDWLPNDVSGLRVLAVNYPTALSSWRTDCDLNKDTLRERACHVMKQLEAAKLGQRPIIWVAHSMGGLLVKQILVLCDENIRQKPEEESKASKNLLNQTKGVVFYSVPHKGSNLDWIERKNLQKLLMLTTEVIELQKGSPILTELHDSFLSLAKRKGDEIKFLSFVENSISSFGVNKVVQWKGVLVHLDSLLFEIGPNFKLNIDHAHTCKPHSKDALTYVKTRDLIKDLMPNIYDPEHEKLLPYISFVL